MQQAYLVGVSISLSKSDKVGEMINLLRLHAEILQ